MVCTNIGYTNELTLQSFARRHVALLSQMTISLQVFSDSVLQCSHIFYSIPILHHTHNALHIRFSGISVILVGAFVCVSFFSSDYNGFRNHENNNGVGETFAGDAVHAPVLLQTSDAER
jgi:hypothetical protein